jgi:mRNA interferase RelE/StbE
MMYQLIYSDDADKQLYKLDKQIRQRIISTLERSRIRPYSHVKKLVASPYFRLRVGEYRVILNIKDDRLIILVIELGHRKNIYK